MQSQPCPSCGFCPSCGRRNTPALQPYPGYPRPYIGDPIPYRPYVGDPMPSRYWQPTTSTFATTTTAGVSTSAW